MLTLAGVALERRLVDLQRLARDRAERREEALAERRAAADREPVDRREHLFLDVARLEHGDGAVAERDDADLDRAAAAARRRRGRRPSPPRSGVGSRSLARMLFETSKARITVPSRSGTGRFTVGRASPNTTRAIAGREERERDVAAPRGAAPARVGTSPSDARRAARRPRRRSGQHVGEHEQRHDREQEQHPRRAERHQRAAASATRRCGRARGRGRPRSRPRRCRRRRGASAARSSASRCLAGLAQAVAELGVARVDRELLAGLGVLDHDHARVGQLVLARVEQPDRDDLVALGQLQQRALPSGRGDEVGEENDRASAAGLPRARTRAAPSGR